MSRYIDAEWLNKYFKRGKEYKGEYVLDDLKYDAPSIDLTDYVPKDFHDKTCEAMAKAHQEEIADILERADADRPQGEWIDTTSGAHYKCSVCGYRAPMVWEDFEEVEWLSDYCPNCGARMFEKDINVPNKKGADDE